MKNAPRSSCTHFTFENVLICGCVGNVLIWSAMLLVSFSFHFYISNSLSSSALFSRQ